MQQSDQQLSGPDGSGPRSRRIRRAALAVALGGGLALGVAGLAYADDAPAPPSGAAPSASAPAGIAPSGPAGAGAAKGQHKPHLDGTVKSIGNGTIMVVDRDGFTRQIIIAEAPDGVSAGTRVHAEGTVNADGVSLDATSVVVAPEPGARGPGGPGHGRPGPAGKGDRPAPPNGAAPAPGASGAPAPDASGAPVPGASGAPVPPSGAPAPAPSGSGGS